MNKPTNLFATGWPLALFGASVVVLALSFTNVPRAVADEFKDVRVINPATMPALVRDVDHPPLQPFQMEVGANFETDQLQVGKSVPITIPPGKCFVLEHVSAMAFVPVGQKVNITVFTRFRDGLATHSLVATPQGTFPTGGTRDVFALSQPMRAYVGGGNQVPDEDIVFSATRNGLGANSRVSFSVSGYFVDVP